MNTANDTIIIGQINYENVNNTNITFVVNSEDLEIHPDENFEYEMLSWIKSTSLKFFFLTARLFTVLEIPKIIVYQFLKIIFHLLLCLGHTIKKV